MASVAGNAPTARAAARTAPTEAELLDSSCAQNRGVLPALHGHIAVRPCFPGIARRPILKRAWRTSPQTSAGTCGRVTSLRGKGWAELTSRSQPFEPRGLREREYRFRMPDNMVGECRHVALAVADRRGFVRGAKPFFYSFSSRFELSDAVEVPQADADTRARLEQAKAFAADRQWDEAIETYRQVMESDLGRVIAASDRHRQRSRVLPYVDRGGPADAVVLYRSRVDAQAKRLYDEAIVRHDAAALRRVIDQFFVSTSGDDALLALGDMASRAGGSRPGPRLVREIDRNAAASRSPRCSRWQSPTSKLRPNALAAHALVSARQRRRRRLISCVAMMCDDDARLALVDFWRERGLAAGRLAYPHADLDLAGVRVASCWCL